MPWAGGVFTQTNGVYTGSTIWNNDKTAGTLITAAHHDTHDYDIAQGINACLTKSGENTATILNLSGTVNASSGIIKVGSLAVLSTYGALNSVFVGGAGNFTGATALDTAIGYLALSALTTSSGNVAVGASALVALTSGSSNVGLGYLSLGSVTSGTYNVGIGRGVDVPNGTSSGQLSLQNALYGVNNVNVGSTLSTGNLGVYVKAPTARLHLIAGTATAGTAPLKLTSGTVLGTPEDGAIEFDGTHLYITISGVRTQIV